MAQKLLLGIVVCYLLWCLLLFLFQGRMLFAGAGCLAIPRALPAGWEEWTAEVRGGRAVAWFAPPAERVGRVPAVVFWHGNAEQIDALDDVVALYHELGCAVLLLEFRGYGRAEGTPSEATAVADGVVFLDRLAARDGIDPGRLVYAGRSLGGGVAAQLATRRRPAALVLQSTFTSVASFAPSYGVPPFLCRNPLRTDRVLAALDVPTLILHGRQDRVVPIEHGRTLAKLARRAELAEFDCGHNDFPGIDGEEEYRRRLRTFLTEARVIGDRAER